MGEVEYLEGEEAILPDTAQPDDPLKESMRMSESNKEITDRKPDAGRRGNEIPPMDWRRSAIGVGMFIMVCALFAMASGNQIASFLGRFLLVVALLLIVVPIVINIVNSASSTIRRLKGTTTKF
jgi:hypothetical protein